MISYFFFHGIAVVVVVVAVVVAFGPPKGLFNNFFYSSPLPPQTPLKKSLEGTYIFIYINEYCDY